MLTFPRSLALVVVALSVLACNRQTNINPTSPTSPTSPFGSPTPTPAATRTTVQFRVLGTVLQARVRYSTPADGLVQVITALPFDTSFTTTQTAIFLSLEGTPILFDGSVSFPFFSIQIIVNDQVFREAASGNSFLQTLSVSGTWRQ